jgi:hypothetical protein
MILLISHITIALASLVITTAAAITPSKLKLIISYSLISMTLVSGTILVITTHQPLLSSCETGLIYLAIALSGVFVSNHRLASMQS